MHLQHGSPVEVMGARHAVDIQRLSAHNDVFTWSEDLEREFQAMKKAIQEAVKLSPIDTKKRLYAFVDSALTVGTAYILAQRKDETNGYNIVSVDGTTFKSSIFPI